MCAFNDELAFVHVPKTGGHACRNYMREHLKGVRELDDAHPTGGSFGHVALRDFETFSGRSPESFERIFAVMRDPYAHQLSQWLFWRDEYARGFRHEAREHAALYPDLTHWLLDPMSDWHVWDARPIQLNGKLVARTVAEPVEAPTSGYEQFGGYYQYWLGIDGEIPANVEIVRFEHLGEEFPMTLKPWAGVVREMRRVNKGPGYEPDVMLYYSDLAAELVERKFAWSFENVYLKRADRGGKKE